MKFMSNELINLMLKNGRNNSIILGIILTEMLFRNSKKRYVEYVYWIFCSYFYTKRLDKISIGISQIQIRHWRNNKYIVKNKFCIKSLKVILDPIANYDMCELILKKDIT